MPAAVRRFYTLATGALGGCAFGGALAGSAGAWLGTLAGLLIADISTLHEERVCSDQRHREDHHRGDDT